MGKKLIVAEKPSVAQAFAKALGASGRHDGYVENEEYIITWCVGHLVTLSYPEKYDESLKKWNLASLPFLPEKYRYEVISSSAKQFKVVKQQLNRKDVSEIYNAGDSGREGEYIQRLIYNQAGWNKSAAMRRVWIDSQTDDEIKRGIKDAKPASEYDSLSDAAYARAIEDYAFGINFSRALSCAYGYEFNQKLKSEKYKPISVGRVMTCVLGMVVEREREIRDFTSTPFYGIEADTGFLSKWKAVESSKFFNAPILYNETGFKDRESAEKLLAIFNNKKVLRVEEVKKTRETKKAPLLFNLAELQNECSKKFKISPDKTLEIAQALYEAKLTTYPRTDARVLSTPVAKEIHKNLAGLAGQKYHASFATDIIHKESYRGIEKTAYTDDSKIADHYAIIPTGQSDDSALSDLQRQVYEMIIDRFLSIFYPPAVYEKVEVELMHPCRERFFASEKILKEYGYLEVTGVDENKVQTLNAVSKGQVFNAEFAIKEGETKPPKRYTSGSMILAMENAGNLIEDEELRAQIKGSGIGTSATRAEVLKKLEKIGYLRLNNKTQVITPHEDGEAVYDIVKGKLPDLLSPKMTASWEKGLSQVERGELSKNEYLELVNNYIRKHTEEIKADAGNHRSSFVSEKLGTCPVCGGDILTKSWGAACSNYKNTCMVSLNADMVSLLKKNNGEQLEKLLTTGKTDLISGFKSKKGNTFDAMLSADKEAKTIKMVFADREKPKAEESKFCCPRCGEIMQKRGDRIFCNCGQFSMWTTVGGKEHPKKLDDTQITLLLDGIDVEIQGLVSKKGTKYSCTLHLAEDGKIEMVF